MARGIVELGGRVVLVARRQAGLDAALAGLDAPAACGIAADIGDLAAIPALVERACAGFGGIDILVNNAGISWAAPAEIFPTDRWQRVLDVNLTAPFLLAREVAHLHDPGGARGASSMSPRSAGWWATGPIWAWRWPYNASKGGLISLTRALAGEWGRHGITVNALCPGFFITELSRACSTRWARRCCPPSRWGALAARQT
jgi:gluconate 5-dehydrogenase